MSEPEVIEPAGPACAQCGRVCRYCRRQSELDAIAMSMEKDPAYIKAYNATRAGDLRCLTRASLVHMLMRFMGKRQR